jgi:putative aldouronate transport system substrate-binding protein
MNRNKMIPRFLSILLVFVMLLTTLSACNSKTSVANSKSGSAGSAKPVHLTILGYSFGYSPNANTPVEKYIEKRFNVSIDVAQVDSSSADAVNLYFASGKKADLIYGATCDTQKMASQGLIQQIDWNKMSAAMPEWINSVASMTGGKDALEKMSVINGKHWYIPWSRYDYASTEGLNIRKDWLKTCGLDAPKTIDDIEKMFVAFASKDPDGDGKKDTYAYSPAHYGFGILYGAFMSQTQNTFYTENGQVKYSSIEDGYKNALKFFAKLYAEGCIDPDFATDDRAKMWDKWSQGRYGCMTIDPGMMNINQATKTLIGSKSLDDSLVYVASLKDANGKDLGARGYSPIGLQLLIGADTTAEQLKVIYSILNTTVSDPDFGITLQDGIKGTDWNYNTDGTVKQTTTSADAQHKEGAYLFGIVPCNTTLLRKFVSDKYVLNAFDASFKVPVMYLGTTMDLSVLNNTAYQTKNTDVTTIADDYYYKAVMGTINIDTTWNQYVAKIKAAGVDEIIAGYKKLLG